MINVDDMKIESYPPRDGGQQVGVATGVRIKHIPSGIEAIVNVSRSQYKNKLLAWEMIEAAVTHPKFPNI
jgi:protein subunit release factor A